MNLLNHFHWPKASSWNFTLKHNSVHRFLSCWFPCFQVLKTQLKSVEFETSLQFYVSFRSDCGFRMQHFSGAFCSRIRGFSSSTLCSWVTGLVSQMSGESQSAKWFSIMQAWWEPQKMWVCAHVWRKSLGVHEYWEVKGPELQCGCELPLSDLLRARNIVWV